MRGELRTVLTREIPLLVDVKEMTSFIDFIERTLPHYNNAGMSREYITALESVRLDFSAIITVKNTLYWGRLFADNDICAVEKIIVTFIPAVNELGISPDTMAVMEEFVAKVSKTN